jgi:glycosyltransferase involved in cell wall biosynthesis
MGQPSVSVIIPAYRATEMISGAVDSVLGQTFPPDEVLVVDDGSPDDLAGALRAYGDRVILLRKPHGGAASARNVGLESARGQFIAFLDADDFWEPEKLERQVEIFHRHAEVGLVAGRFFEQPPGGPRIEVEDGVEPANCDRVLQAQGAEAFALAIQTWTGMVMLRRKILGSHRFVPGLEPAEDRDLWVRLISVNPVYFLSEPLATAVLKAGSLSRSNLDVDCANMLKVARRHEALLGKKGLKLWEAHIYKRWAGNHLVQGRPRAAIPHAWQRLRLQPFSPEAWWILLKSITMGFSNAAAFHH